MTQEVQTTTTAAKRPNPSDPLFKKALSAIQSACPEALPSTDGAKNAKDYSCVIVGVGLDKKLDEVKAAVNKTYPAKISLVHIRSRATQAPTRLVRSFLKCETTKTLLISRGLMIGITPHRCEESKQAQSSSPLVKRDVMIQCYECQGFGHEANACTQEARCITVRDVPEILTTYTQIVANAVVLAKTIRYTDFDPDNFRQQCKERQDLHIADLLCKLLKVPPDSSKQDSPDPSAECDQNHCHQRRKLL